MLQNVTSTKSYYILDMQESNFQNGSPNIVTTSKTGKTTVKLQNIFTKVII